MPSIEIRCPKCSKIGLIEIDESSIKNVSRGLLAVNVASSTICPHSFIAYVDKNLKIRDYFVPDFQIKLNEASSGTVIKEAGIPGVEIVDLDLIKLNLTPRVLAYFLRGIFLKRKIAFILDEEYLHNHILNFFNYITQNSFEIEIKIISDNEYNNREKEFDDHVVLRGVEILNDKEKILNPNQIHIENELIQKFLSESQSSISLVLLKDEIKKTFVLSKSIAEFISSYKDKEKLSTKIITDYLKDAHGFKVSKDFKKYLNFLLDIVEGYFGVEIAHSSDVADFLEFI